MSDRLNSILSKLVTSIEGVKDEKEIFAETYNRLGSIFVTCFV